MGIRYRSSSCGDPVGIRYRSSSGGVTTWVVSELSVGGGYVSGWCHLRDGERTFRLSSVYAVMASV